MLPEYVTLQTVVLTIVGMYVVAVVVVSLWEFLDGVYASIPSVARHRKASVAAAEKPCRDELAWWENHSARKQA